MEWRDVQLGQRVQHAHSGDLGTVRGRVVSGHGAGTVRVIWDSTVVEKVPADELVLVGPENLGREQ